MAALIEETRALSRESTMALSVFDLDRPFEVFLNVATRMITVATIRTGRCKIPSQQLYSRSIMTKSRPVWFGMKVTPEQKRKIRRLAEREGTSAKEAVLRLIEDALSVDNIDAPQGSFLSGIEHIIGSVEGPPDLASNSKYMNGFGR